MDVIKKLQQDEAHNWHVNTTTYIFYQGMYVSTCSSWLIANVFNFKNQPWL